MSTVKIKHPGLKKKETKIVTLEHADAIFKLQREKDTPKDFCWTLVKESPKNDEKSEEETED